MVIFMVGDMYDKYISLRNHIFEIKEVMYQEEIPNNTNLFEQLQHSEVSVCLLGLLYLKALSPSQLA